MSESISPVNKRWYWLPLGLYIGLSLLYLFGVPGGESPDEPSHLQCIEQVSILGRLPEIDPRPTGIWWSRTHVISGYLCHHLPLYYLLSGLTQQITHRLTGAPLHFEFPPNYPDGPQPVMFQAANKPSFFSLSEPPTVVVLRALSIGLGLLTLWAAYRVTAAILPDNRLAAIGAATLVAGWPQFVFISRSINNDVLGTALASSVLILVVTVGRPRRLIFATIAACLAILAKLNMVFAIGILGVAYALEWGAFRDRRAAYVRSAAMSALIVVGLVATIALQPTLRQHTLADLAAINTDNPAAVTPDYWLQWLSLTLSSGYARLGWMNVPAPDEQVAAWWLFIGATSTAGVIRMLRAAPDRSRRIQLALLGVWMLAVLAAYAKFNLNRFQPQFRLVLPLLPVLAALSAAGYFRWAHSPRGQQLALVGLALVLLLVNVWIVFGLIVPTYATPLSG